MPHFSIVPMEVWQDKRLTLEQLRVLGVLFSFRGKDTNTVWPSRAEIAKRCGMHPTSALERMGWLTKEGKGGYSKASRYTINVPETVAERATVVDSATVAERATRLPVAESATPPVAESATRKEETSEQTKRTNQVNANAPRRKQKFDARAHLLALGVDSQIATDFIELRKGKRAPITPTVIKSLQNESDKAGITLGEALTTCCLRGWSGFRADWLRENTRPAAKRAPTPENFDAVDYGTGGLI